MRQRDFQVVEGETSPAVVKIVLLLILGFLSTLGFFSYFCPGLAAERDIEQAVFEIAAISCYFAAFLYWRHTKT